MYIISFQLIYYFIFSRIMAKIDEEMLTYYCNEDLFILEFRHSEESEDLLDIILAELPEH